MKECLCQQKKDVETAADRTYIIHRSVIVHSNKAADLRHRANPNYAFQSKVSLILRDNSVGWRCLSFECNGLVDDNQVKYLKYILRARVYRTLHQVVRPAFNHGILGSVRSGGYLSASKLTC